MKVCRAPLRIYTRTCMDLRVGDYDLEPETRHLLIRQCKKQGSRHPQSDAEGTYLGCSYYWRGAFLKSDALDHVHGCLNFKTQDAKDELVIFAETQRRKRTRSDVHKQRTLTRRRERLLREADKQHAFDA